MASSILGRIYGGLVRLTGAGKLENLEMLPIGATYDEAVHLWGEPVESGAAENRPPAALTYVFDQSTHEIVVNVWEGVVHEVAYWSHYPSPEQDLRHVMKEYGDGQEWKPMTPGYLYWRADDQLRLWCSAVPAIGVGTLEYNRAASDAAREGADE